MLIITEEQVKATLDDRAIRELQRGERARAEFAIRAQRALKETMDAAGPVRHMDGLGRKVATIHPELAARLRVRDGQSCLHDPAYLGKLIKENPFLRCQTAPAKLAVRVDGLRDNHKTTNHESTAPVERRAGHATPGDPAGRGIATGEHGSQRVRHETAGGAPQVRSTQQ